MNKRIVGLVLIGLLMQVPVFAADEKWNYEVTLYLFAAGLDGTVGVRGVGVPRTWRAIG